MYFFLLINQVKASLCLPLSRTQGVFAILGWALDGHSPFSFFISLVIECNLAQLAASAKEISWIKWEWCQKARKNCSAVTALWRDACLLYFSYINIYHWIHITPAPRYRKGGESSFPSKCSIRKKIKVKGWPIKASEGIAFWVSLQSTCEHIFLPSLLVFHTEWLLRKKIHWASYTVSGNEL